VGHRDLVGRRLRACCAGVRQHHPDRPRLRASACTAQAQAPISGSTSTEPSQRAAACHRHRTPFSVNSAAAAPGPDQRTGRRRPTRSGSRTVVSRRARLAKIEGVVVGHRRRVYAGRFQCLPTVGARGSGTLFSVRLCVEHAFKLATASRRATDKPPRNSRAMTDQPGLRRAAKAVPEPESAFPVPLVGRGMASGGARRRQR
jgi:hypothetical protein